MRSLSEVERELSHKRRELDELVGTETEIYSRIVGYYRSVRNWNKGKREEFRHRVTFHGLTPEDSQQELAFPMSYPPHRVRGVEADVTPSREAAPAAEQVVRSVSGIASCTYFFRQACPTCKPVRSLISGLAIAVCDVDVDTSEGMALAIENQILATPTAIFADSGGRVVCRSSDPTEIAQLLRDAV